MRLSIIVKTIFTSTAFCCAIAGLQSCSKKKKDNTTTPAVTYAFSVRGSTLVGYSVSFQSTAPASSTLQWNFGDGSSSTEATPAHVYASSDSFTVTLTVDKNTTHAATKTIFISTSPDAFILDAIAGNKNWHGYVIGDFQSATKKDTITSGLTDQFAIAVVNKTTLTVKGDNLDCYFVDNTNRIYYFRHYLSDYSWREVDYFYGKGNIRYVYYPDQSGDPVSGPYSFATVLWNP